MDISQGTAYLGSTFKEAVFSFIEGTGQRPLEESARI
jgi:hypothetical protein